MPWEAWFTLAVVGLVLVALIRNYATDVVVVGAVSLVCLIQGFTNSPRLPSAKEAFSAYGNEALVTVGVVDSVVDLQKMRGLAPAASRLFNLDVPRLDRVMVEAVVSNSCPIVGSTIRDGKSKTFAVYQPTRLKRLDWHRTSNGFHEPRQIGDFHTMKAAIEQLAQGQNATASFLYRHDDLVHTIGSEQALRPPLEY